MNNFKKEGYSTKEAAQILHVCPQSIGNYIQRGELKASMSNSKIQPGKRRRIRILKEHIGEYMLAHRDRFTKEELDTWGKFVKKQDPIEKASTEEVHSLEELTGAWAGLVKSAPAELTPATSTDAKPDIEIQYLDSYSISIDGRISIGNVSAVTAGKIINALLEDKQISYNELTIRKGTCIK